MYVSVQQNHVIPGHISLLQDEYFLSTFFSALIIPHAAARLNLVELPFLQKVLQKVLLTKEYMSKTDQRGPMAPGPRRTKLHYHVETLCCLKCCHFQGGLLCCL